MMDTTSSHTILAGWVGAIVSAVKQDGYEWRDLAPDSALDDPSEFAPGARLPHMIMRDVWDRACDVTGDEAIPLRAAQRLQPNALHALGYCLQAASSLNDTCHLLYRHFHVISTAAALNIKIDANTYTVTSVCEPTVNDEGFEMFMAFVVELFRLLSPEPLNPIAVSLRRRVSGRAACDRYRSVFQAPVEFEAPMNSLVFDREPMTVPLRTANPEIRAVGQRLVSSYLAELGSGEYKTLARSQILNQLQSGRASEEGVAKSLNLSCSSLSRRLRQEGTTYRALLHETQRNLAFQYLKNENLAISEISFRLGFEDLSSFSRSFRRWTGIPPREWRRRYANATEPAEEQAGATDRTKPH